MGGERLPRLTPVHRLREVVQDTRRVRGGAVVRVDGGLRDESVGDVWRRGREGQLNARPSGVGSRQARLLRPRESAVRRVPETAAEHGMRWVNWHAYAATK